MHPPPNLEGSGGWDGTSTADTVAKKVGAEEAVASGSESTSAPTSSKSSSSKEFNYEDYNDMERLRHQPRFVTHKHNSKRGGHVEDIVTKLIPFHYVDSRVQGTTVGGGSSGGVGNSESGKGAQQLEIPAPEDGGDGGDSTPLWRIQRETLGRIHVGIDIGGTLSKVCYFSPNNPVPSQIGIKAVLDNFILGSTEYGVTGYRSVN
uniref:Pantothenate kinase 1 n=1 Tax=Lygus hesperus TaxID=30085 RepID=A0A0A9YGB6_LYGHE